MRTTLAPLLALIFTLALAVGCQAHADRGAAGDSGDQSQGAPLAEPVPDGLAVATLAGGCFWCMQPPFDDLGGIKAVVLGYTGGTEENPTYQAVASGQTSHLEAAQILFDPDTISFEQIVEIFWRNIDPTDTGGQFADRGDHYTTAIFYHSEEQRQIAERSKAALDKSGRFDEPIATVIRPAMAFWVAEDYHQDFYKNYPQRYRRYYQGSGRARFFESLDD